MYDNAEDQPLDVEFPEAPGATRIEKFRAIVEQKSCMSVDGQPVDLFSASVVVQVHDALNEDNRAKLMGMKSVLGIVQLSYRVAEKAKSR